MKFDLALIGFGVIGVETLHTLVLEAKKKQKLNIVIIDKEIKNIPGGEHIANLALNLVSLIIH